MIEETNYLAKAIQYMPSIEVTLSLFQFNSKDSYHCQIEMMLNFSIT